MRRLNRKKTLNLVKELDAFPKVPDSYVETSASGGTVSLIAFTTMALLTIMEFSVYQDTWMKYEYEVDKDFSSKLRINIDITVAMKCQYVGADVLDLAETMVASADGLVYEPAIFDLSPQQKEWQRMLQLIQSRLQEEHSLQDVIFKSAFKSASTALPPREDDSSQPPDACRIHGHLYVNKVAGNFHITVGKAIPHPRGHAHLAALVSHDSYNFSHRIDHLSFGELVPAIINPLDGTEKIAVDNNQMFQYFITVVPTKLHTYKISADTHQFSVTERERVINHAAGSHGVSGIFMKYDLSSLMVTVTEEHMPFWQFFVRLCGIIGGIFSTTGMLHGIGKFIVEIIYCRFRLGSYKPVNSIPSFTDESFQENFTRVMSLMSQIEYALECQRNPTHGIRESEALCAYVLIYIHLVSEVGIVKENVTCEPFSLLLPALNQVLPGITQKEAEASVENYFCSRIWEDVNYSSSHLDFKPEHFPG